MAIRHTPIPREHPIPEVVPILRRIAPDLHPEKARVPDYSLPHLGVDANPRPLKAQSSIVALPGWEILVSHSGAEEPHCFLAECLDFTDLSKVLILVGSERAKLEPIRTTACGIVRGVIAGIGAQERRNGTEWSTLLTHHLGPTGLSEELDGLVIEVPSNGNSLKISNFGSANRIGFAIEKISTGDLPERGKLPELINLNDGETVVISEKGNDPEGSYINFQMPLQEIMISHNLNFFNVIVVVRRSNKTSLVV